MSNQLPMFCQIHPGEQSNRQHEDWDGKPTRSVKGPDKAGRDAVLIVWAAQCL
jgi:hypothetical protein